MREQNRTKPETDWMKIGFMFFPIIIFLTIIAGLIIPISTYDDGYLGERKIPTSCLRQARLVKGITLLPPENPHPTAVVTLTARIDFHDRFAFVSATDDHDIYCSVQRNKEQYYSKISRTHLAMPDSKRIFILEEEILCPYRACHLESVDPAYITIKVWEEGSTYWGRSWPGWKAKIREFWIGTIPGWRNLIWQKFKREQKES